MKSESTKKGERKPALSQAGMSNTGNFDNSHGSGQSDTPVKPPLGQIPPASAPKPVNVPPSTPIAGGTVSTSETAVSPKKSFFKDAGQALAKSEAATLRKQAQQLRTAADTCSYNITNLGWPWCNVEVKFENNRKITIEEAVAYAKRLDLWANLMEAIDAAIRKHGATGTMSCNLFVGAVGQELDIPYFRNPIDDDYHMANNMYDFISNAVNSSASGWVKLNEDKVQDKADEGKFIIGVAHSITAEHGHIVIAVPSILLPQAEPHGRNIPCILDGQHAKEKVSYKPSMVFGSSVSEPIWAFYKD